MIDSCTHAPMHLPTTSYFSMHGANQPCSDEGKPQGQGNPEPFGPGDIVGVELDLHGGTLRFLKNDRWVVVGLGACK